MVDVFPVVIGILKSHLVIEKCPVCGFIWKIFLEMDLGRADLWLGN